MRVFRLVGPDEERIVHDVCAGEVEVVWVQDLMVPQPRQRAKAATRTTGARTKRRAAPSRAESSATAIVAKVHELQERGDDNDGKEAEGEELADAESDIESEEAEYGTAVDCVAELDFWDMIAEHEAYLREVDPVDGLAGDDGVFNQPLEGHFGDGLPDILAPSDDPAGAEHVVEEGSEAPTPRSEISAGDLGDVTDVEPDMDPVGVAVQSGDGPRVLMLVPRPGRMPGVPQEGKLPHMRLDFTDVFGNACSLRYDHVDHAFIAYCGKHKDARCTATRTLNAGKRPGSGRPLGF